MKQHRLTDSHPWRKTPLALAVLAALQGAAVQEAFAAGIAPNPVGPEFQVNTTTTGDQEAPAMAMDANGNFVVVWESNGQDGDGWGIYAQRYDKTGAPQGSEFQVNTTTKNDQRYPAVAMDKDGDFVVAWQGSQVDSLYDIYAQRYNAAGIRQGPEFRVNTYTTSRQWYPAVAMNADGNFVVAWQSLGQDGNGWGIYAQRYDKTGMPQGPELPRINNTITSSVHGPSPAVAMDKNGFVVVWNQDETSIQARFYDAEGNSQGPELQVSLVNNLEHPAVAMNADGNFVVAWEQFSSDIGKPAIYARRYTFTNGLPQAQGPEFRVSTLASAGPAVAMNANGNFMVAWGRLNNSNWDIYAQRYNADGTTQGPAEFRVNTYPANVTSRSLAGYNPSAAMVMDKDGNFKIVWQSFDGNETGIAGQRYALNCHTPDFPNPLPDDVSGRSYDSTSVAEGKKGTFSFTAKFCNHGRIPLSNLVSQTTTLGTPTFSNNLLNRHYGPKDTPPGVGASAGGVGSVLDFPAIDDYSDQVLAVDKCVKVTYQIGLQQRKPFDFFVNIYGDDATQPGSSVTGLPCSSGDP